MKNEKIYDSNGREILPPGKRYKKRKGNKIKIAKFHKNANSR
jgi:hypothetical protein